MKKNTLHVLYHIAVVLVSAAIALSLPDIARFLTRIALRYWAFVENQELFLVVTEITAAVALIVAINLIVRAWSARNRSRMAQAAGLHAVAPATTFLAKRRVRKLKHEQGAGRNVMIVNATGFRSFTDPDGDLHDVLLNCREAKVMLLDPLKEGVVTRAKSLADPEITPEGLREQIIRSIDFLKGLKAQQKKIRLKLYPDVPLLKMAILGDYLSLQHYPSGINVRKMSEYVFKHGANGGLFNLFYQYFVTRWLDPAMPEYDLDTDELVYRDKTGNEWKRESFNEVVMEY